MSRGLESSIHPEILLSAPGQVVIIDITLPELRQKVWTWNRN